MQMLAPQPAGLRSGLVGHLAKIDNADATRALAKLAVFAPEDSVRLPAVEALKNRNKNDYTAILLEGLDYPWPAVAERAADAITGGVPSPHDSIDSFSGGYGRSPDLLVRVDVTYLRQDFSEMQHVDNAAPWPAMQRFDFLVRTRTLSEADVRAYREAMAQRSADYVSPYHRAAAAALRSLTGRDA